MHANDKLTADERGLGSGEGIIRRLHRLRRLRFEVSYAGRINTSFAVVAPFFPLQQERHLGPKSA